MLDPRLHVHFYLVDPLALQLQSLVAVGYVQRVLLALVHELALQSLVAPLKAESVQFLRQVFLLLLELVDPGFVGVLN